MLIYTHQEATLTKKKKRLIIVLISIAVVLLLALLGIYIATNYIFSRVTETVGETMQGETVTLPVLDDKSQIVDDKNISVVLDEKTMKELEAKIPISEKLEVLTMLAKSLSSEDYSTLVGYAAGGVNNEKFNAAYALMREKLGPEEKQKIKSYYAKYIYLLEE